MYTKTERDSSAERVDAEVEVPESREPTKFRRDMAGELVVGQVDSYQRSEVGDAGWDLTGEAFRLHIQGHHEGCLPWPPRA